LTTDKKPDTIHEISVFCDSCS